MIAKIFSSERGSISLFVIIIITAIFFLNMVFIDFSRIMAAKLIAEKSVKAALRSELSNFDQTLYQEYGLFGYCQSYNLSLTDILITNLQNTNHDFAYIIFDTDNMEYDTQYSQELVLLPVFKHQILEEMKYQAPLDFYNKFANIIDEPIADLKDGIKYYEQLSELAEFVFKRNEAVGSVFQLQEAAADLLSENLNQKISEVSELIYILNDNRLPVGLHTEQLTTIIATIERINIAKNGDLSLFKSVLNEASESLLKAKGLNNTISQLLDEDETYKSDKDLLFSNNYLSDLGDLIREQWDIVSSISNQLAQIKYKINLILTGSIDIQNLVTDLAELGKLTNVQMSFFQDTNNPENKIVKNREVFNQFTASITEQYEQLQAVEEVNMFAFNKLIKALKNAIYTDEKSAEILNNYQVFLEFNNKVEINDPIATSVTITDLHEDSRFFIKNITNKLNDYLVNFRDVIYLEEYAFKYFSELDSNLLNNISQSFISGNFEEGLGSKLHISEQEIEYIIYGNENASMNLLATLKDIFIIRFVFNIIDALANPTLYSSSNPVVILLEASTYAIKATITDFTELLKGEKVPLMSKRLTKTFGYSDYLKLLYFLRGNEDDRLLRELALISFKTKINLLDTATYGVVNVDVPINLWFLPTLPQFVTVDQDVMGKYKDRAYIITKRVAYGY